MPIIPISGSAVSKGALVPMGSFKTTTTTASAIFANIPQIYQDLMLVLSVRGDSTSTMGAISVYINNVSGTANFSSTLILGDGANAVSSRSTTSTPTFGFSPAYTTILPTAGAAPSVFGNVTCHIMNYRNTTSSKTALIRTASDLLGSGTTSLTAANWANTAAIGGIEIQTNGNWAAGSTFTLYGIRSINQ